MNWELVQQGLSYGLAVLAFSIPGGIGLGIIVAICRGAWNGTKK